MSLALALFALLAAPPPPWKAISAAGGHCAVEVRGERVIERGRGEMTCARHRRQLACLWTHTNGFYQEAWLIDLRRREVRQIALPAWGSGEVVRLIQWRRGALELWVEKT